MLSCLARRRALGRLTSLSILSILRLAGAHGAVDGAALGSRRWLRTGDKGWFDAHGRLFLTGRFKEIINRAGEKVP